MDTLIFTPYLVHMLAHHFPSVSIPAALDKILLLLSFKERLKKEILKSDRCNIVAGLLAAFYSSLANDKGSNRLFSA